MAGKPVNCINWLRALWQLLASILINWFVVITITHHFLPAL